MPLRITEELCEKLKPLYPIYINTQFNHPREITEDSVEAAKRLIRARICPYYVFHPKQVKGTKHFYVTIEEGLHVMDDLRGQTSGLAIPTYILNAPHGLGKIPLQKQYILEMEENKVKLRTWEGKVID